MPNPKNKTYLNLIPARKTQTKSNIQQRKERNNKGETKVLGHAAKRDKEKDNHGFSVKRKERWNPIVIRGKFLSSNKIVLNVLFMLDNYPLKTHTLI